MFFLNCLINLKQICLLMIEELNISQRNDKEYYFLEVSDIEDKEVVSILSKFDICRCYVISSFIYKLKLSKIFLVNLILIEIDLKCK